MTYVPEDNRVFGVQATSPSAKKLISYVSLKISFFKNFQSVYGLIASFLGLIFSIVAKQDFLYTVIGVLIFLLICWCLHSAIVLKLDFFFFF